LGEADGLLLDTLSATAPGGTGESFDWTLAAGLRERVPLLFLAGGLRPENVGDAIAAARPHGVDVSSGVEASPGRKDKVKLRAFVAAVRAAAPERA
jgi:phosphoribosylanthranilate isomerase